MMFEAIRPLEAATSHTRWLHDLRNAVSTASVATALGRRLTGDDAYLLLMALSEAEEALGQCRALLLDADDHLREDETFPTSVCARSPQDGERKQRPDADATGPDGR